MSEEQEIVNNKETKKRGLPFTKNDPRINRSGRPKELTMLRALALEIAHELARDDENNEIVIDGHHLTVIEAILRKWANGDDFRQQRAFVELAFGKFPEQIELSGHLNVEVDGSVTTEQRIEQLMAILDTARARAGKQTD